MTSRGPVPENAGWTIFSYLIAGMLAYGLLGWLAATLTHMAVLLPLGALAGLAVATAGIVYKYGRS
jgi:ATP synthase protein I